MTREESILYSKALALASEKHAGQIRKDGSPYIFHPLRVSKTIADAGYNINYQIAGLFHDLLEDTDTTLEEIKIYGEDVLEAVKLVSKNYCNNMKDYIPNILKNHMASVVKNADRIDNLWDACNIIDEEFQKYYLKKSKEYEGKFSMALDNSIYHLEIEMNDVSLHKGRKYPSYSKEEIELYVDKEKRKKKEEEEKIKKLLNLKENSEAPDYNHPDIVFYTAYENYYCVYEKPHFNIKKEWMLTEVGWIPDQTDLYMCYGLSLIPLTKEKMEEKYKKIVKNL